MIGDETAIIGTAARPSHRKELSLIAVLWLGVVISGTLVMLTVAQTPGVGAVPPAVWPETSGVPRTPGRAVLVMFVHPHCPCSRASIGELDRLVAGNRDRFSTQVMFVRPAGIVEGWEKTDLWRQAEAIPGVSVHCDAGGVEARRFHAGTSGATVLYDGGGNLLFEGGITAARGHAGDNAGSAAVTAVLGNRGAGQVSTPVFGCPLCEKTECRPENTLCKP